MQYCGSFNNNGYRITLEIATKMNINETKPDTVVWGSILPFKIFNNAIFKFLTMLPQNQYLESITILLLDHLLAHLNVFLLECMMDS